MDNYIALDKYSFEPTRSDMAKIRMCLFVLKRPYWQTATAETLIMLFPGLLAGILCPCLFKSFWFDLSLFLWACAFFYKAGMSCGCSLFLRKFAAGHLLLPGARVWAPIRWDTGLRGEPQRNTEPCFILRQVSDIRCLVRSEKDGRENVVEKRDMWPIIDPYIWNGVEFK